MKKAAIALLVLAGLTGAAQAQSMYAKAGLLGVGLGYAHGINKNFGARADFTTMGSLSKDGTSDDFDYEGKFKYNQVGVYGDWFPFAGGFHLTGGLNLRQAHLTAHARPNQFGTVTIGDTEVGFGAGDSVTAKIKLPNVAPYLGLGWGHNVSAQTSGFAFFADVGVSIGKPKVSLNVNDSLMAKLNTASGGQAQAEIDKQINSIKDDADKIKVFPQIYIGVAYKF
ncbi:MAG: hypothetical protein KBT18_01040 [Comamonas sp.]|nr:hypothetical protein [Candidatus Comamonas equi]